MGLVVGLFLPGVAACLALRAWGPGWITQSPAFQAALAICIGMGASALTTFWFVASGGAFHGAFIALDAGLWASVSALSFARIHRQRRRHASPHLSSPQGEATSRTAWWLKVSFLCVATISLAAAVAAYLSAPHGDWDAWAIWNQKARFIVRAGDGWAQALTIGWSQPGHPLLLPTSVARLWAYAGAETTLAPALLGIIFGAAAVVVVVGVLGPQRPRAWIAGAVLLAPGAFLREWTAQGADIPFAFFMVSSLGMLVRAPLTHTDRSRSLLLLGGGLAGLAAWTKNEGLVLVGVTTAIAAVMTLRSGRPRDALWWIAGSAPAVATLVWFKAVIAPEAPYYLPDTPLQALLVERLFTSDHQAVVAVALWERLAVWGTPMAPGVMLVATVAAVGLALTRRGGGARMIVVALATMATAYYGVYLLTSLDVTWLVATTFDRLLVQLWPSAVLAAFITVTRERNAQSHGELARA